MGIFDHVSEVSYQTLMLDEKAWLTVCTQMDPKDVLLDWGQVSVLASEVLSLQAQ